MDCVIHQVSRLAGSVTYRVRAAMSRSVSEAVEGVSSGRALDLAILGRTKARPGLMNVSKAQIVANLRVRGLDIRADWAERTLPDLVDTVATAGLLKTRGIAEDSLPPGGAGPAAPDPDS
jgi:hypothetical protein